MSHLYSFLIGLFLLANPVAGIDEAAHTVDADAITAAINQTPDDADAPGRINPDSALANLFNNNRLDAQSRQKIADSMGAYPFFVSRSAAQKLLFDLVIFGKKPLNPTGKTQQFAANTAIQNFNFDIYRASNTPVYLSTIVDAQLQKEGLAGGKKNQENSMQLYIMKKRLEEDDSTPVPLDLSKADEIIQENARKQLLDLAYDCVLYTDQSINSQLLRDLNQTLTTVREQKRLRGDMQERLSKEVFSIENLTEKQLKKIIEREMLNATERGSALILYKMSQLLDENNDQKVSCEEVFSRMPPVTINEYVSDAPPAGCIEKTQSLKRAQASATKAKVVMPDTNTSPSPKAKPKINTSDALDFSSASTGSTSSPHHIVSTPIPAGNLLGNGSGDSAQTIISSSAPTKLTKHSALPLIGFSGTAVAFASAMLYLQRQDHIITTFLNSIIDANGQSLAQRLIDANTQRSDGTQQENIARIERDFNLSPEKMAEALRLLKKQRGHRTLRNGMIIPLAIGLLGSLATGHEYFKKD